MASSTKILHNIYNRYKLLQFLGSKTTIVNKNQSSNYNDSSMYEEFKSIESDIETLLIRLRNLQREIKKYDRTYIVNTEELSIRITKAEVMRLLSISEQEVDLLDAYHFFTRIKVRKEGYASFLLKDVIWLRRQGAVAFDADGLAALVEKKNKRKKKTKKCLINKHYLISSRTSYLFMEHNLYDNCLTYSVGCYPVGYCFSTVGMAFI